MILHSLEKTALSTRRIELVRLLTTGRNTAIENLAIFVEKHCAPLTENIETNIKDSYHLRDIIDNLNANGLPKNVSLVSFDIVNVSKHR